MERIPARPAEETRMTLGEHLDELRRCVLRAVIGTVVGMAVAVIFGKYLFQVLFWPLSVATGGNPPHLYFGSLTEGFSTYVRVCLIAGLIISSPYGLYQMWKFIGAGLYEHERRAVRAYLLPSVLLFLLGISFYFALISWLVVKFFLSFGISNFSAPPPPPEWASGFLSRYFDIPAAAAAAAQTQPAEASSFVVPWLMLDDYVSFTATMSLVFGLAFQTPLVVLFLARTGIVPLERLRRYRRHVVVLVAILAAVITPTGDAMTMLAMAIPMYGLYELGLLAARRKGKKLTGGGGG